MDGTIAIVGLGAKAEVGFDDAHNLMDATNRILRSKGIKPYNTGLVISDYKSAERVIYLIRNKNIDAVLICIATWSEDTYILQLLKETQKSIILHAFPNMQSGSLCGVMQMASVMHDIGCKSYRTVFAEPGSEEAANDIIKAFEEIEDKAKNPEKEHEVEPAIYIGSIGGRCGGMTEIAFDEFALFEKCGAIIVNISESELTDAVKKVNIGEVNNVINDISGRGYHLDSKREDIKESAKYYIAMKTLIKKYGLSGLAIKCYTKFMGKICMGYSLLSDEGYACSCEGDVNSAVMMKLLMRFTGQCVNNTDILNPISDKNEIIFAHCGSGGFSIAPNADEVHLAPVRIVDSGVCSLFRPRKGIVTAADLVGHGNSLRMSVMTGEAVDKEYLFPGNQACIRFKRNVVDICKDVIDKACGHHWMIGYGDVRNELKKYCRSHGIVFQDLT